MLCNDLEASSFMKQFLASALIVGTLVVSANVEAYPWADTRATCRAECGEVQESVGKNWFDIACGQYFGFGRMYRRCKRQLIRRCRTGGFGYACPEVTTTTISTTSTTTVRATTTTIRRTTTTTLPSPSVAFTSVNVISLGAYNTCNGRRTMVLNVALCGDDGAPISRDHRNFRLVHEDGSSYGVNECHYVSAGEGAYECITTISGDDRSCMICWLMFDRVESFAGVHLYYSAYGYTATYDWVSSQ